jgi:enoyl-CoA hydratase/carnithine racemase
VADGIVLYQVDDKVGIITLNRPEKLNAISRELQLALTEAFARADADPATSVVLLRAEGRSFCAGYDIGTQPEGTDDWRSNPTKAHAHLEPQLEFEMAPWLMKKPVVAAVQGHVLGGGCELAMLCDMTIAADNAAFGEPEVRFFGSRAGDRYADDHWLQEGPRAALFRRPDRCQDGTGSRHGEPHRPPRRIARGEPQIR